MACPTCLEVLPIAAKAVAKLRIVEEAFAAAEAAMKAGEMDWVRMYGLLERCTQQMNELERDS